jgi:hypothetical protein
MDVSPGEKSRGSVPLDVSPGEMSRGAFPMDVSPGEMSRGSVPPGVLVAIILGGSGAARGDSGVVSIADLAWIVGFQAHPVAQKQSSRGGAGNTVPDSKPSNLRNQEPDLCRRTARPAFRAKRSIRPATSTPPPSLIAEVEAT